MTRWATSRHMSAARTVTVTLLSFPQPTGLQELTALVGWQHPLLISYDNAVGEGALQWTIPFIRSVTQNMS